jgi:hypothetical protein
MNFMRTVTLPGRSALSFRVDIINLPNRTTFANPNLNPASTDFGRIHERDSRFITIHPVCDEVYFLGGTC